MTVLVIRTDGREEIHEVPKRTCFAAVERLIDCEALDTVTIGKNPANRTALDMRMPVMLVDDGGQFKQKPTNAKATAFYHSVCKPGTTHEILGDVAIVDDSEFE